MLIEGPKFDVDRLRLLLGVFTICDDDLIQTERCGTQLPYCLIMGKPLSFNRFPKDEDSTFLLLENKDST